jgi:hypothetical protein
MNAEMTKATSQQVPILKFLVFVERATWQNSSAIKAEVHQYLCLSLDLKLY